MVLNRQKVIYSVIVQVFLLIPQLSANCVGGLEGETIDITVKYCEHIVAQNNDDVQKYAGELNNDSNLSKAYTGALVTDEHGSRWMYPSGSADPCADFPQGQVVQKKGYSTCCDTGKWGKCVFGGQWLTDLDADPINAFQ